MARRSTKNTDSTPEAQEGNVSTITEEAPVQPDETTTESPATDEAAPAENTGESDGTVEHAEVDLTAFKEAVESAVAERDTSTGDLTEVHYEAINAEYRKLDGVKARNKGKALLVEGITAGMNALDAPLARAYLLIQEHLSATGTKSKKESVERKPVDPTEAYVEQLTSLNLARALITAPEGVAEDANDKADALYGESYPQAETFLAWMTNEADDKGDEPEAPAFVKNAVKLALGRSAKAGGVKARATSAATPFTGERRNVEKHMDEAFSGVESGTFLSIAQIRSFVSAEYGEDHPSAGAISARLFPKTGKVTVGEGSYEPAERDGKKGAVKI